MICNIDARGRQVRKINGIVCCLLGGALLLAAWLRIGSAELLLILGNILVVCGLFQIFESRKGWCLLRAMGIKTRI